MYTDTVQTFVIIVGAFILMGFCELRVILWGLTELCSITYSITKCISERVT